MIARNDEVVLGDGQGTTRATVDPVQAVTSTFTTDGFGNPVAQWGSSGNPYRYAGAWGYRDDGDAGLLHVGARYYDPQVGRFISRDVVLSEHPYLYCEHEPIMRVDPGGEDDVDVRVRPYVKWRLIKVKPGPKDVTITITLPWRPLPFLPEIGIDVDIKIRFDCSPNPQPPSNPADWYGGPPPGTKLRLPNTSPPREVYI